MRPPDLTIALRISLSFGLIVLGVGIVGGIGLVATGSIETDFSAYERAANTEGDALEVEVAVGAFVSQAREYIARNSTQREAKMEEAFTRAIGVVEERRSKSSAEDGQALADVSAELSAMGRDMRAFAETRRTRNALIEDELRDGGTTLRHAIDPLVDASLAALDIPAISASVAVRLHLLLGREYSGRYIERLLDSDADRARTEMATAVQSLERFAETATGTLMRDEITEIRQGLSEYAVAVGRVLTLVQQENRLASSLFDQRLPSIEEHLSRILSVANTAAHAYRRTLKTTAQWGMNLSLMGVVIGVLAGAVLAYWVTSSIVRPLKQLTRAMAQIAAGDLSVAVPGTNRGDEIGVMAKALSVFVDNARQRRRLEDEQQSDHARRRNRQDDIDQLIGMFSRTMQGALLNVQQTSHAMNDTSQSLIDIAETTNKRASAAHGETARTAEGVQAVAAAAQQLSQAIDEIGRQVTDASAMASDVRSAARHTMVEVDALSEAMVAIGDVVHMISQIASQTNLLALNATIEAQRAGEAGRGFAVVAQEVKNLANQTGKATADITQRIEELRRRSGTSLDAMRSIETLIVQLADVANAVAASAAEQQAATSEIARAVQEASSATTQVLDRIGEVRSRASETERSALAVGTAADTLSSEAAHLAQEVGNFIQGIEADDNRKSMQIHRTDLPCQLTIGDTKRQARIARMSAAVAELDGDLGIAPGLAVTLSIEGWETIPCRAVGTVEGVTCLQLPLDRDSLDKRALRLAAA